MVQNRKPPSSSTKLLDLCFCSMETNVYDMGICAICKYENGMLRVARNAFNFGEVWNPVCCHGNKTFKLVLWSTFRRILLQRNKHF